MEVRRQSSFNDGEPGASTSQIGKIRTNVIAKKKNRSLIPTTSLQQANQREKAINLHKTLILFFRDCELEKRREANFSAFVMYFHTGKLL